MNCDESMPYIYMPFRAIIATGLSILGYLIFIYFIIMFIYLFILLYLFFLFFFLLTNEVLSFYIVIFSIQLTCKL